MWPVRLMPVPVPVLVRARVHMRVWRTGLQPHKHLGKSLAKLYPVLLRLNEQFEVHVCGEGGEFESLVVDSPLFHQRIDITKSTMVLSKGDVAHLKIEEAVLVDKETPPPTDHVALVAAMRAIVHPAYADQYRDMPRAQPGSAVVVAPPQASTDSHAPIALSVTAHEVRLGTAVIPQYVPVLYFRVTSLHTHTHTRARTHAHSTRGWRPLLTHPVARMVSSVSCRAQGGSFVAISGLVADVATVAAGTPGDAMGNIIDTLRATLHAHGLDVTDVVLVHVYVLLCLAAYVLSASVSQPCAHGQEAL